MKFELIIFAVFFAFTLFGWVFWKKKKDYDYLLLARYGAIAMLAQVTGIYLKQIHFPFGIDALVRVMILIFWPIWIVFVLRILFWNKKK